MNLLSFPCTRSELLSLSFDFRVLFIHYLSLNYIVNWTMICIFYFFMSTSVWYLSTRNEIFNCPSGTGFREWSAASQINIQLQAADAHSNEDGSASCLAEFCKICISTFSRPLWNRILISVAVYLKESHVLCRESRPPVFPLLHDRMQRTLLA